MSTNSYVKILEIIGAVGGTIIIWKFINENVRNYFIKKSVSGYFGRKIRIVECEVDNGFPQGKVTFILKKRVEKKP